MTLPTLDVDVRAALRRMGMPICLFGEDAAARRKRLEKSIDEGGYVPEELSQEGDSGALDPAKSGAGSLFYYPAEPKLCEARRCMAEFSFQAMLQRRTSVREEKHWGNELDCSKTRLTGSQAGGKRPLSSCALSTNDGGGTVAISSWDSECSIWDFKKFEKRFSLQGHEERAVDIAYSPKDKSILATASADKKCLLWRLPADAARGQDSEGDIDMTDAAAEGDATVVAPASSLLGHQARLGKLAWHPCGKFIATTSFDCSWRLWDAETGTQLLLQEGQARGTYAVDFHPDGSLIATGALDSHTSVWDMRSGKRIMTFSGHVKPVVSCAFSPLGHVLASGSMDNTIHVLDLRSQRCGTKIAAHMHLVSGITFAGRGGEHMVSCGYDGLVKIWNCRSWALERTLRGHEGLVMGVDAHDEGCSIVTCGYDRTWKVWSI
eukprot:g157.t1